MTRHSREFDWVTERTKCSIENVFEQLRLDVKSNVEKRQELRERSSEFGFTNAFSFASNMGKFSASMNTHNYRGTVIFVLRKNSIVVLDENEQVQFSATVTLNNNKQCRLVVGNEELEPWQFRKKTLEKLFFGDLP